jgi:SAM-dependent methyltransferase
MYASVDKPAFWEEKYKANQTNWDTKIANPVFKELLDNSEIIKPGKMLIVGCGRGYDAILAAEKGYQVTAIDFSSIAINYAKQLAIQREVNIDFLIEDIFTLNNDYKESFDFVYEYTTYCAINPERRKEFAKKISSLIKKGGRLITILFPVDKREGGPPFSINVQEFHKNFSEFLQLELSTKQINSIKPRKGKEILQIYFKKKGN